MRQFRYWFGFGILLVALIAVIKVKDKLEDFLNSARQVSQFDFRYLGYLNYLNFVVDELDPGVDEKTPLPMAALALASNKISLPELIQKIGQDVQIVCEDNLNCDEAWANALVNFNSESKVENIDAPNHDELELRLSKELKEQIFLLTPEGMTPPFLFRMSEFILNQSLPVTEISDEQKNLLRYYDEEAVNFAVQPEFSVVKNFANNFSVQMLDCKPVTPTGAPNIVRIERKETESHLLELMKKRRGQITQLWGRLEQFQNLDFFHELLENFSESTLHIELTGSLEWIQFNFLRINHEKLMGLYSDFKDRIQFELNSDSDCSPAKSQSLQRLIDRYVKGVKDDGRPLIRTKGYDELSELSLFLY